MTFQADFRPPRWHWAVAFAVLGAAIGYACLAYAAEPAVLWQRVFAGAFIVLAVLGLVDVGRTQLRLEAEGVRFERNLRERFVPRADIDSVTWARGTGVSLKLVAGGWVRLPEVGAGSQALANSIRAWLKRPRAPDPA